MDAAVSRGTHLIRAFTKLGVDERGAAVIAPAARGILPTPGSAGLSGPEHGSAGRREQLTD